MILRHLEDIRGTDRDVKAPTFNSRRFLLRQDGMGFSFHDTVLDAGTETLIWYVHHLEAVYCIEGEGEIELIETGERHQIRPGTFYALNGHEKHWLRARTILRMVCVFNPPLTGGEIHDERGTYPLIAETPDDAVPALEGSANDRRNDGYQRRVPVTAGE